MKVLKQGRKQYFNNLNSKSIMDSKKFLTNVKLLFLSKTKTANTIIHHKNHGMIKNNKKISDTLNKYFTILTRNLKLKKTSRTLKKKSLKHLLKYLKNKSIKKNLEAC